MSKVIINIKELYTFKNPDKGPIKGKSMKDVQSLKNAFLGIENGKISAIGLMSEYQKKASDDSIITDLGIVR